MKAVAPESPLQVRRTRRRQAKEAHKNQTAPQICINLADPPSLAPAPPLRPLPQVKVDLSQVATAAPSSSFAVGGSKRQQIDPPSYPLPRTPLRASIPAPTARQLPFMRLSTPAAPSFHINASPVLRRAQTNMAPIPTKASKA